MRFSFFPIQWLILFCCCFTSLQGQTGFPYRLEPVREAALLTTCTGLLLTGSLAEREMLPLSPWALARMDAASIPGFDRGATRQFDTRALFVSDYLMNAATISPLLLGGSRRVRSKLFVTGTMLMEATLLNNGLTRLTKAVAGRARPLVYNPEVEPHWKEGVDARRSFFSGHTSTTAMFSFFTAKVYHDLYPDSPLRPWVWAAAATLPAATGLCRYLGGKHFPSDVIVGYGVGALTGILVPQLHKVRPGRQATVRVLPVPPAGALAGLSIQLRWPANNRRNRLFSEQTTAYVPATGTAKGDPSDRQ